MGGVYESGIDPWKGRGEPLMLLYRNNNGLADGRTMTLHRDIAYVVCYNPREGLILCSGNSAFQSDAIGILSVSSDQWQSEPGHYIPLKRFRLSPEVRTGMHVVNNQVYFGFNRKITLVEGNEELTFRIKDAARGRGV